MAKAKTKAAKKSPQPRYTAAVQAVTIPFVSGYRRLRSSRDTAPHQTFVLTRKRDKLNKPQLEGFISFTLDVFRTLWKSKGLFSRFLVLYFVLAILMVGLIQSSNLSVVNEVIDTTTNNSSNEPMQPLNRAFVVVSTSLSGALNSDLSDIQQFYMLALYIFVALITIWLLRHRLAAKKVTLRDGLYSAGAPLVALYALVAVALLQLVPAALAALVYSIAVSGGFINGGIEAALFSIALFLIAVLTLYFMLTTVFAFMIATIPGTYPLQAYKTAKKIIAGQRLRLLFRLFWLALIIVFVWYLVLIPVAIIVNALSLNGSPIMPIAIQVVTGFCIIYGTSYFYLLYRRMIDDPVAA